MNLFFEVDDKKISKKKFHKQVDKKINKYIKNFTTDIEALDKRKTYPVLWHSANVSDYQNYKIEFDKVISKLNFDLNVLNNNLLNDFEYIEQDYLDFVSSLFETCDKDSAYIKKQAYRPEYFKVKTIYGTVQKVHEGEIPLLSQVNKLYVKKGRCLLQILKKFKELNNLMQKKEFDNHPELEYLESE